MRKTRGTSNGHAKARPAPINIRLGTDPWPERRRAGKELRGLTPRESHADWSPPAKRPDPVATLQAINASRQAELLPIRMGRMAASRFGFLRGAAAIMAWDLNHTPTTGLRVVIDGDAHLGNFGLHGTPQRDVVLDLNDFDETTIGPWEWDLKRLAASINVAGRDNELGPRKRRRAVMSCVAAYRATLHQLQCLGILDVWYLHTFPGRKHSLVHADDCSLSVVRQLLKKAQRGTSARLLNKLAAQGEDGHWQLSDQPPIQRRLDAPTADKVIDALNAYVETLSPERRVMLQKYRVVDVAHHLVGVGSVGKRVYLALLFGNGDADPLFLQIKEAESPALAPYLPALPPEFAHEGRRVVFGQRLLQASSDVLLGWTTIDDRPFYVRQMKDLKGSIPVDRLPAAAFLFYAQACGALLARAHARTGDAAGIAGYCGRSEALDVALADFAEAYGDQTERDHAALMQAIDEGRIEAEMGV